MRTLRQRGFNLIEVLVAMSVLAFGLMGLAGMQTRGVQFNQQSYSRTQAAQIADDYAERIYANRPGMQAGLYSAQFGASGTTTFDTNTVDCATAPTPPAPNTTLMTCARQPNKATPDVCNAAQLAYYDQWVIACGVPVTVGGVTTRYGGVKDLLRNGRLRAECQDAPCTSAGKRTIVTVTWTERRTDSSSAGSTDQNDVALAIMVRP